MKRKPKRILVVVVKWRHLENALLSFLFFSIMRFLFFLIFTTGENTVFCSAKILSERSYKGVNIALVYRYERALWLRPCDHQQHKLTIAYLPTYKNLESFEVKFLWWSNLNRDDWVCSVKMNHQPWFISGHGAKAVSIITVNCKFCQGKDFFTTFVVAASVIVNWRGTRFTVQCLILSTVFELRF